MSTTPARDEFPEGVKKTIAQRAGHRCSNPGCRRPTIGPHSDPEKAQNIGNAGHIHGARAGGPRYDPRQTSEQRKSIANAIWLCATCHDLVDGDESQYDVATLLSWRTQAEHTARSERDAPAHATSEITFIPITAHHEDSLFLQTIAAHEERKAIEAERVARCTDDQWQKDKNQILKKHQSPLPPVRKKAYEIAIQHTECKHRNELILLLSDIWDEKHGALQDADRAQVINLWNRAHAWQFCNLLLDYWLNISTTENPAHYKLHNYIFSAFYHDPSTTLGLVLEHLRLLSNHGKPEQPTDTLISALAETLKHQNFSSEDWEKIHEIHEMYKSDTDRFASIRDIKNKLD
ncbi:hypothetical protein [Archangium sp.]|uniref:hypothetical protein n=1 Tax=Archangium sp. TaxID=1872627 RepID=UPI00286D3070|nr:hypothetical protein [Archangium sp.]